MGEGESKMKSIPRRIKLSRGLNPTVQLVRAIQEALKPGVCVPCGYPTSSYIEENGRKISVHLSCLRKIEAIPVE